MAHLVIRRSHARFTFHFGSQIWCFLFCSVIRCCGRFWIVLPTPTMTMTPRTHGYVKHFLRFWYHQITIRLWFVLVIVLSIIIRSLIEFLFKFGRIVIFTIWRILLVDLLAAWCYLLFRLILQILNFVFLNFDLDIWELILFNVIYILDVCILTLHVPILVKKVVVASEFLSYFANQVQVLFGLDARDEEVIISLIHYFNIDQASPRHYSFHEPKVEAPNHYDSEYHAKRKHYNPIFNIVNVKYSIFLSSVILRWHVILVISFFI